MVFLYLTGLYNLGPVHSKHRPVVGELGLPPVVIQGQRGLEVIALVRVENKFFLVLFVPAEQDSIAPSWDPHFLGSVVNFTVSVVLVGWVEVQRALHKPFEDVVLRLQVDQLVVALKPRVVFLVD